ncbi:hypothetical protein BELL_0341g00100 [Botrytis elliptica]|uniref:Uncharacterized protein n=1 Tax=Botrytis elliptica TaxID=278938 RepID=A0A4Z1JIY0_9HELO|nr:hypothetical protein BELL_0341g00100 [Botrytis elliptica]
MSDTVEHAHGDIILGTKSQLPSTRFIFTADFLQLFVVRSLLSAYPSKPSFGSDTFPIINHSLFRFMFSSHFY